MSFKDYFSKQAKDYAKYRPQYPSELIQFVSELAPGRERAWDCATGNGQAAVALANYFDRVIATDASAQQIENAERRPRVSFEVAAAEASGLPSLHFDLIVVATAAHWFDLPRFYAEAKRVLKPEGILAMWTYGGTEPTSDPGIAEVLRRYAKEIVGPYFAPELQRVWGGYGNLPFPFNEIRTPEFSIRAEWDLEQMLGHMLTWSATQKLIDAEDKDPRELIREDLSRAWGSPDRKIPREWKIDFRVGKLEP